MLVDPAPPAAGSEAHHQGGSFSTQVPSYPQTCLLLPPLLPRNSSLLSAPTLLSLSLEQLEDCSEPGPALSLSERKVAAPLARRLSSSAAQPSIPCGADPPPSVLPFSQALLKHQAVIVRGCQNQHLGTRQNRLSSAFRTSDFLFFSVCKYSLDVLSLNTSKLSVNL